MPVTPAPAQAVQVKYSLQTNATPQQARRLTPIVEASPIINEEGSQHSQSDSDYASDFEKATDSGEETPRDDQSSHSVQVPSLLITPQTDVNPPETPRTQLINEYNNLKEEAKVARIRLKERNLWNAVIMLDREMAKQRRVLFATLKRMTPKPKQTESKPKNPNAIFRKPIKIAPVNLHESYLMPTSSANSRRKATRPMSAKKIKISPTAPQTRAQIRSQK